RYAAGVNGPASDRILSLLVNNVEIRNLSFPRTGSWSNWATLSTRVNLQRGSNDIKILMDNGEGGYINVDYIELVQEGQGPQSVQAPISSSYELNLSTFATHTEFQSGGGNNPSGTASAFGAIEVASPRDGSGRVFISSQTGKILGYDQNGNDLGTFLDLLPISANTGFINGEGAGAFRGLMYFDFHPDFNQVGRAGYQKVYVGYQVISSYDNNGANADYRIQDYNTRVGDNQYAIAEFSISTNNPNAVDPASFREVFRVQMEGNNPHGLGEVAFNSNADPGDADYGLLYAAIGDANARGNSAPDGAYLQNLNNPFGKIIRINPLQNGTDAYSIPASNPYFGQAGLAQEIYAIGFRDPQTFSFARDNDGEDILITFEIGASLREEIMFVRSGGNYGWERFEGTRLNNANEALATGTTHDLPVVEYDHTTGGFAVIGGLLVSDPNDPNFTNKVIFSDLPTGKVFFADYQEMLQAEQSGTQAAFFEINNFTLDGVRVVENAGGGGTNPGITFEDVVGRNRGDLRFGFDEVGNVYFVTKQSGKIFRTGLIHSLDRNTQNPKPALCFTEVNGEVSIEAEDFSAQIPGTGNAANTDWTVISEANASGALAVEAGPNTGLWTGLNLNGARLDYDINFTETGTYFVYVRSQGATGNDDSYHIGLNGRGISNKSAYGMGGAGNWSWQNLANEDEQMNIEISSPGKQTFNIWVREDGVQIDKIVLKKVDGIPGGQGPTPSTQLACVGIANQAPIASFTATPSSGAAPLALRVDASSSSDPDGSISSYAWDFGDGSQAGGPITNHTYTSIGTYTLRLTITDAAGLSNSTSRTIQVTPPSNGPLCYEEVGGSLVMEAENFSSSSPGTGNASSNSWQKISDINASNSEGLQAAPNIGTYTGLDINGPRVDYNILFNTAGTYRIYIRTQGPSGQDDSYHVGLNGNPVSTQNGYGMGWTGTWGWAYFANEDEYVEVVVPSTGEHTFNIWMREDGVEIDKIVLNIQPGIPSGSGPNANNQIACSTNTFNSTQSFSVEEVGGNGVLHWGNFFEDFKDNYSLERSIDGNTFEVLEHAEIIVDENYHTHTDPNIRQYESPLIKYRLKIKDARGIVREVREGILNFRKAYVKFDLNVFPNPARDKLNVAFDNSSEQDLHLSLMNGLGQTLHRELIEGSIQDGIVKLDVSDYAEGIYYIRLTDNEKSQLVRVMVE
ncbi:MAG: PKD domain-containing protein, partial [Bacteroidota bacterium]